MITLPDFANSFLYMTPIFISEPEAKVDGDTITIVHGLTTGNIINHNPDQPTKLRHEFVHSLQYERFRVGQEVIRKIVPGPVDWLEENLHLRIGEDFTRIIFDGPQTVCHWVSDKTCSRNWWNPTEVEAELMETAAKKQ